MITTLIYIIIALIIVVLNAFFVLGEFALVKVRRTRLLELAKTGGYKENLVLNAYDNIDEYLSSLQIGITMTSLALGWVGEPSVGSLLAWLMPDLGLPVSITFTISLALSFLIVTSLHVVFGEQVPKLFSIKYPEKTLLYVIVPTHWFYVITKHFRLALTAAAHGTLRLLGINPKGGEAPLSQDELRLMFSQSQEGGRFSLRRLMMFENLFDFEQIKAREIMTPRAKISALKKSNTWAENFAIIKTRKFSRYPLYDENIDDAKEYVLIKEMSLEALNEHAQQPIEEKYTYPILNLDENTPVEAALREFQTNRRHQALIRDARGNVAGLLTLEDVLEELVGEIRDEYEKPNAIRLSNFFLPRASIVNLKSTEKYAVFDEILDAVYRDRPIFSKEQAREFIKNRERMMTCSFSKGVAFPHARVGVLNNPMVVAAISRKGIDFQCGDDEPVRLIFLILTPFKEPAMQLKLLAELAAIANNNVVKERLLKAKSGAEIAEILLAFENTVPD